MQRLSLVIVAAVLGGPQVVDTTTGESWPLTNAPLGGAWYAASWAPDGSFLVLDIEPAPRNEYRQWHGVTADTIAKATTPKGSQDVIATATDLLWHGSVR
jgi:hypothetical protein